jgi:hypothetical protein
MRKLLMAFAVAVVAAPALAADTNDASSYVCVPDYATGFRLDRSGKWEPGQFSVRGKQFLLGKRSERWFWTEVGPLDARPESCDTFTDGFAECKYSEGDVLFNRKTLRFQLVRRYGYVTSDVATDKEINNAPPYIMIGKCSAQ